MWSKLSHKSKAIAFFVGLVFIIILGYVLSLQKTLDLWTENSSLTILTGKSEATIIQEIGLQTRKKQRIDSLLSQLETGASNVETINRLFVISEKLMVCRCTVLLIKTKKVMPLCINYVWKDITSTL